MTIAKHSNAYQFPLIKYIMGTYGEVATFSTHKNEPYGKARTGLTHCTLNGQYNSLKWPWTFITIKISVDGFPDVSIISYKIAGSLSKPGFCLGLTNTRSTKIPVVCFHL